MGLREWSSNFHQQIQVVDGGHIEFCKMLIISVMDENNCTQFSKKTQHGADYEQMQDAFQPTM